LAIQLQGLLGELGRAGFCDVAVDTIGTVDGRMPGSRRECDDEAVRVFSALRDRVLVALSEDRVPIVLGGDHSVSIGSIAGALRAGAGDLAVLWIDAHMDLNTPFTTPSGNMHGMPLAVLTGQEPGPKPSAVGAAEPWIDAVYDVWPRLGGVVGANRLQGDRTAWLGLRDVDPGEGENLRNLPGALVMTMQEVDKRGVCSLIDELHAWLVGGGATRLWVSFDVDVLDPVFAPGTGTAVRGGLTYRESHLLAELLAERLLDPANPYRLLGVDVVEVNPLRDTENETAKMALGWLCSLLGKTILKVEP
jgi:arginase